MVDWSGQLWKGKDVLGDQDPAFVSLPFLVPLKAIATRSDHTLALDGEGAVWSWGTGAYGQLDRLESGGSFETPQGLNGRHRYHLRKITEDRKAGINLYQERQS